MARSPKFSMQATAMVFISAFTFAAPAPAEPRFGMSSYHIGTTPWSVDVVDVNGDGALDIVAPAYRASLGQSLSGETEGAADAMLNLSVFLGRGDGRFDRVANNPPAMGPSAVGDLTGDGDPDLLAIAEFGGLAIFEGIGAGRFEDPQVLTPNARITRPVIVDLDNDGANEAIFGIREGSQTRIVVLKQSFGDLFDVSKIADSNPFVHSSFGFTGESVAVKDVNNDGLADIAAITSAQNAVQVLLNNGAGSFLPATTYPIAAETPLKWNAITVGDADNDGFADIALLAPGPQIGVLTGDGAGGFAPLEVNQLPFVASSDEFPVALRIADVQGDDDNEIIFLDTQYGAFDKSKGGFEFVGRYMGGAIRTVAIDANGSIAEIDNGYAGMSPRGLALADVNDDARLDAIVVAASQPVIGAGMQGDFGQLNVYLGTGDRPFSAPTWLSTNFSTRAAIAADVDNDGDQEALTVNWPGSQEISVHLAENNGGVQPISVLSNGENSELVSYPWGLIPAFPGAIGLHHADFTGDGNDDILVIGDNGNHAGIHLAMGDGDGAFTLIAIANGGVRQSAIGDMSGDAVPEIVFYDTSNQAVRVFRLDSSGAPIQLSFTPVDLFPEVRALRVADITGDGNQDVVLLTGSRIAIFAGDGAGSVQFWAEIPTSDSFGIDCVDMNEDGRIDILVGGWVHPEEALTLYVNLGDGNLAPEIILPGVAVTVEALEAVDINGDGRVDIAILSLHDHLKIAYQNAAGVFDRVEAISVGNSAFALDTADINGDGAQDLIVLGGETSYSGFPPTQPSFDFNAPFLILSPTPTGFTFGDLTGNGLVDGADLAALLTAWGTCDDCLADLNNDGFVDGADLAIILTNWS